MKISDFLTSPLDADITSSRAIIDATFAEEPPDLTTFVTDRRYLGNPALSDIQYEAVRYVEQVLYADIYPHMAEEFGDYWQPVRMINFANLMWGKGGGKDHTCRMMTLRVANILLCLRNPQEYFGMPGQDTIHMLNVAMSSRQAQQAFFNPMARAVKRGWFADKCEARQTGIEFDKNVESVSGHSDAESQEGLNIILGIADEIDGFRSRDELIRGKIQQRQPTNTAEGILEMMSTSASTRFPDTFKNVRISYPRYLGSTIMRLVAESRADVERDPIGSREYPSGPHATWVVNPRVPGRKAFAKDYAKDPVLARAKYECAPASAIAQVFRNELAVTSCMTESEPVTVTYTPEAFSYRHPATGEVTEATRWRTSFDLPHDLVPITGALYHVHVDLALTGDRAGVAMSHVSDWLEEVRHGEDEEQGLVELTVTVPVVRTDFVLAFESDLGAHPAPREIQIRWARELIEDLRARGFAVAGVSYDSFQSAESIQLLNDLGIEAAKKSTDKDPALYRQLRDMAYARRWSCAYSDLLLSELLKLEQLPTGKIDHPPAGSKDLADAVACSVDGAVELGGSESPDRQQAYPEEASFETLDISVFADDYDLAPSMKELERMLRV